MVSWIIPIVRQSKTDLFHRQVMRPLRHGGSHFVNYDVRDASLVCGISQFLTAWRLVYVRDAWLVCGISQFLTVWRLVLSMKSWSYIWLEFGLFSTIIAIIRACACWALFEVTLTNTVLLIYIYISDCMPLSEKKERFTAIVPVYMYAIKLFADIQGHVINI